MPAPVYEIKDVEERIRLGQECQKDIIALAVDVSNKWKVMKEEGPIKIYRSDDVFKNSGFRVFKSEVTVDKSCAEMFRITDFRHGHRAKWDKVLDGVDTFKQLSEECYVTRHMTKKALKGVFSARETVDVTIFGQKLQPDGSKVLCQTLVTMDEDFKNYPPTPGRVRAKHFCTGFVFCPVENNPNKCRFVTVLCSDLNMNSLGAMMTEWVKPALMTQQCYDLMEYLEKNPNEPSDL